MTKKTYVHYGNSKFDINKFSAIRNRGVFPKPFGGLWASPVDAEFGWIQWCEQEDFAHYKSDNKFQFKLSDNARVLEIHSVEQMRTLITEDMYIVRFGVYVLDFEKLTHEYDAIELFISETPSLYNNFYGWDCDSILILNPNVIKVI